MTATRPENHRPERKKRRLAEILKRLGPGFITGISDDDPSGIATYAQAGALLGTRLLWSTFFTLPFMIAVQEASARVGRVTGQGLGANLRRHYSMAFVIPALVLLLVANVLNLTADLAAVADGARLLLPRLPFFAHCFLFALVSMSLQIFVPYRRYVHWLKWLTLSILAYPIVMFLIDIPWTKALHDTFLPKFHFGGEAAHMLTAVLGTTISPYLFFWQASEEVEEQRGERGARPLKQAPQQGAVALERIRFDTISGMLCSNLVAFMIILSTAATVGAQGSKKIESAAQAAEALRPLAGNFCSALFALGFIGTGLLALPVLAGASAYAWGEVLGWKVGLEKKPSRARGFYGIIAAQMILALLLNLFHVSPLRLLLASAVVNGIMAVPFMFLVARLVARKDVMGRFKAGWRLQTLLWMGTAIMLLACLALF